MIRVLPAVIEGPLQQQLGVTAGDIGLSMSFYYYAYGPMQIAVGVLLDKLGARGPLSIAAASRAIGALTFAAGSSLFGLGAGRFLMGSDPPLPTWAPSTWPQSGFPVDASR